jgi:hypothetical protein
MSQIQYNIMGDLEDGGWGQFVDIDRYSIVPLVDDAPYQLLVNTTGTGSDPIEYYTMFLHLSCIPTIMYLCVYLII